MKVKITKELSKISAKFRYYLFIDGEFCTSYETIAECEKHAKAIADNDGKSAETVKEYEL